MLGPLVKDDWKPSVHILDAETGTILTTLKLAAADEEAVLAATNDLQFRGHSSRVFVRWDFGGRRD